MKFKDLDLDTNLLKGIEKSGFVDCLPVQAETFPHSFEGEDVCVQSQTGTGKSAAFLVSIFHNFLQNTTARKKQALIIAPTRELADQIGVEAKNIARYTDIKIGVFYGGVGYTHQERLLREGVDVIIGTPGRMIDFNMSGKLKLDEIGVLVIDEADRLFDMGFFPDLKRLMKKMPVYPERQTMLFSATLDSRVKNLASDYMHDPVEIELTPDSITVENISQSLYHVARNEKLRLLIGLLKQDNPANAIIFTNTKRMAERVAKTLRVNGFNADFLTGDLPQSKRLKIINNVKKGVIPFLVATDVAARGIHIEDLEMVINYDLPEHYENYVHRIGRTARVGKEGKAISLACEQFVYGLEDIESYIQMKIPVAWADDELFSRIEMPPRQENTYRGRGTNRQRGDRGRSQPKRRGERQGGAKRAGRGSQSTSGASRTRAASSTERPHAEKRKSAGTGSRAVSTKGTSTAAKQGKSRNRPVPEGNRNKKGKSAASTGKVNTRPTGAKRKSKKIEDRLEYYREKYGEDFTVKGGGNTKSRDRKGAKKNGKKSTKSKGSILSSVSGIFKKKKSKKK